MMIRVDVPELNDRRILFSNGVLSFMDVLKVLLGKVRGDGPINVIITTWQLGKRNIDIIETIARNEDVKIKILLDVSYKNRCVDAYRRLTTKLGHIVWLTKNHTKILAVSSDSYNFVVLSSANFNKNLRLEFFEIIESLELYQIIDRNISPFFAGPPIGKRIIDRGVIGREFNEIFAKNEDNYVDEKSLSGYNYEFEVYDITKKVIEIS